MKNPAIVIEFISSSNKLKMVAKDTTEDTTEDTDDEDGLVDETKTCDNVTTYATRKKQGIIVCLELLKHDKAMTTYLKTHKKKDDLADAFLQGIWYMNKNN